MRRHLQAVLSDRRRAQRGSVLSGVLIITLFLAIISGALMTALSTNLLVSRTLVHRVINEATVSSAVEVAIDRIQNLPIGQACPALAATSLNGTTASAAYATCETAVDSGSPPFARFGGSSPFSVDGTHVHIASGWNVDDYVVADSSHLYEFTFGSISPNWSFPLAGPLTGPVTAIPDQASGAPNLLDLVPTGSSCSIGPDCVAMLTEVAGQLPVQRCTMDAASPVQTAPAAGLNYPSVVFFADTGGDLYAYSPGSAGDADCNLDDTAGVPGDRPVVGGPFVFRGPAGVDEVYLVASDGSTSQLVRYTYSSGVLSYASSVTLPFASAVGAVEDSTSLPANLAISYAGGGISLAAISASYGMTSSASVTEPTTFAAAPSWCSCPTGRLVGVGGQNGILYVFDTSLNPFASVNGGSAISTSPATDTAGDWFYGAADARLHLVVEPPGQASLYQAGAFGPFDSAIGSSAIAGGCPDGLCVYVASLGQSAYLTTFDARNVTMTACIGTSPSACTGDNPRLWVKAQVGAMGAPRTVQVSGWSYYSP